MRTKSIKERNREMWKLAVFGGALLISTHSLPAFAVEDEHGHGEVSAEVLASGEEEHERNTEAKHQITNDTYLYYQQLCTYHKL